MKSKILLFLLITLGLTISISIAQPILTATGINPVVGNRFSINLTNYVNPGDSGINQTWDLTSMGSVWSYPTISTFSTLSTSFGSYFTGGNIAIGASSLDDDYFIASPTRLQYQGHAYTDIHEFVHFYSSPQDIMHFPFTYGSAFTDSSVGITLLGSLINDIDDLMMNIRNTASIDTLNNTSYHDSGIRTAVADGYGTLETPAGTFNNVLRVHYTDKRMDSNLGVYNLEMYAWFQEGVHYPLAVIDDSASTNLHWERSCGYWLENFANGLNEETNESNLFHLFPNPSNEYLRIQSSTVKLNNSSNIVITNALGEVFKTEKQERESGLLLDTKNLPSGIYFLEVLDDNVRWVGKFIKE